MKAFSHSRLVILTLILSFWLGHLQMVHAGLIVNLEKLVVELGPDGRTTRQLEIANTSDQPADINVFAADWVQDENGAVDAVDPTAGKGARFRHRLDHCKSPAIPSEKRREESGRG